MRTPGPCSTRPRGLRSGSIWVTRSWSNRTALGGTPANPCVLVIEGFARAVDEPLGAPHNPLDDRALGEKYLGLAGPVLGAARARATLAQLWRLDELDSVTGLCDALAG
jgi:hypothetical protein